MKKPRKIVWASAVVVEALQPFVDEVLGCVAEHTGQPGVAGAMVTDESAIYDFLRSTPTYNYSKHPFKDELIRCTTSDTPENRELVKKMAAELEVPVDIWDRIYEVAIRLRDK